MSRNTSTGVYTRVDNSFSNPVVGTTISPTDADTFFDDVESSMNSFIATSTTSLAIQTGSRTFTVASDIANKVFIPNMNVHAFSLSNSANYMDVTVTSYNTSTGALVTDCYATGGSGTITDWVIISAGARGATGATGATGDKAGFKYTFNSATSGDPGSGKFLFNNATFASATAFNISETDGESIALASLLATLDDGTSTNKCLLVWVNADGSKGFIGYLTGTITDNGTYDTFSFTPVTSWGSPANNDVFRMQPFRIGDKGADGTVAVSGTPTIGQFGIWTNSTTVKGVSITGLVKGNGSSDPTAAVAGTDYFGLSTASQAFSGGVAPTEFDNGTKSSGTFTPDPSVAPKQKYTNNGAHILAASSVVGSCCLRVIMGASAGATTFSGFDKQLSGDTLATTSGNQYRIYIEIDGKKTYQIVALQ